MADKKSLFDKYKIIGEDGNELSAENYTPAVPGGEVIEVPVEDDLQVLEALTGFPEAVKETLENLPITEENPHTVDEDDSIFTGEPAEQEYKEEFVFDTAEPDVLQKTIGVIEETVIFSEKEALASATDKKKVKKQKKSRPVKEKKIKEPQPEKVKKPKKEKTETETAQYEPLTKKDHITFGLAIFALVLAIVFLCVKYFPTENNETPDTPDEIKITQTSVKTIQLAEGETEGNLLETDFDNTFCVLSSDNKIVYYQYENGVLNAIQPNKTVTVSVKENGTKLNTEISFISRDGMVSGYGIYADGQTGARLLRLTDLPSGYEADGKALLLVSEDNGKLWNDSFVVDAESGKTERFLSKKSDGADYCVLTDEGLNSSNGKIPFFSGRNYENSTQKDLFIKDGSRETLLAKDVYGYLAVADGDAFLYLVRAENGEIKAVRNENGEATDILTLQKNANVRYSYSNGYLLDEAEGLLYSVSTGERISLDGYTVTQAEQMAVSGDGKYLAVLGYVENITDYQLQIFDLTTGNCLKYSDEIFLQHTSLYFIDNKTVVYTVGNAYQGCRYVIADISKGL